MITVGGGAGRYDDRSRRGDWENQRRPDDGFQGDRRDPDRRDDRRYCVYTCHDICYNLSVSSNFEKA